MLEIERLAVSYGEVAALRDVSLTINKAEIVTLIGGNGAGKTTTLKTVSGLLAPTAGGIRFEGHSIVGLSPDRIVARGIALVPEGRHVFPQLSVENNLIVGSYLVRDPAVVRDTLDQVYAMFPQLKERRRQLGETLSGGEQQMLALGRAIMSRPRLMLLDEPSLGKSNPCLSAFGRDDPARRAKRACRPCAVRTRLCHRKRPRRPVGRLCQFET